MASLNRCQIIGNLGRDPETRYTQEGSAICNITVATSSSWKDKNSGEKKTETEWHKIVFYNRLAEIAGEYLRKGSSVYIDGRLKTRKWQNKEGVDQYTTEIIADQMQMLGGRDGGENVPEVRPQQAQRQAQQPTQQRAPAANLADMEDDIPF